MAKSRLVKSNAGRGREKSEFDQQVLEVRRTARVVAGGRRFSFRVVVALGDRNGRVGLGTGKGADVSAAVEKAASRARKNLLRVPLTAERSIAQAVRGKVSAARVFLKPARGGTGIVAGGPLRIIADLAGIKNVVGKILGRTANKMNNAKAAMEALKKLT